MSTPKLEDTFPLTTELLREQMTPEEFTKMERVMEGHVLTPEEVSEIMINHPITPAAPLIDPPADDTEPYLIEESESISEEQPEKQPEDAEPEEELPEPPPVTKGRLDGYEVAAPNPLVMLNTAEGNMIALFNAAVPSCDIRTLQLARVRLNDCVLLATASLVGPEQQEGRNDMLSELNQMEAALFALQELDGSDLYLLANARDKLVECKLLVLQAVAKGPASVLL